ncbi:MAG: hypothetical protein RML36_17365, partial [Anaerolineae bacterium]|nr:hypothetical protein [Anaerolineae bacterium]
MQDVGRTVLDQLGMMAQEGAESDQVGVWAEGLGQEAEGVEGLNPLAVEDVGFVASGEAAGEVAADEAAMNAALLQDFEERNPVDAGGFHGDGLDA